MRGGGQRCSQGMGMRLRCGEADAARAWGGGCGAGRRTDLRHWRGRRGGCGAGGGQSCSAGVGRQMWCGEADRAAARAWGGGGGGGAGRQRRMRPGRGEAAAVRGRGRGDADAVRGGGVGRLAWLRRGEVDGTAA